MLLSIQTSGLHSFLQLLGVILIFLFVLVITVYTTKWIAGYQKKHSFNRNIRVVETMKLTTNKYIQIVEVGEVYLVIAIGKDEITMLAQLTREQLDDVSIEELNQYKKMGDSFGTILEQMKEHLPKSRHKKDE